MTVATQSAPASDRELVLTRIISASPDKLFRAWTEPEQLKKWFAPLPYKVSVAETDVRPGGSSLIVMRGPDGIDFPNRGVYLEVIKNERLVVTDAYINAWEPSEKPFMTAILTFENQGGKTKYTARVRHWTVADREAHEKMGFHQGWGAMRRPTCRPRYQDVTSAQNFASQCADQSLGWKFIHGDKINVTRQHLPQFYTFNGSRIPVLQINIPE